MHESLNRDEDDEHTAAEYLAAWIAAGLLISILIGLWLFHA